MYFEFLGDVHMSHEKFIKDQKSFDTFKFYFLNVKYIEINAQHQDCSVGKQIHFELAFMGK